MLITYLKLGTLCCKYTTKKKQVLPDINFSMTGRGGQSALRFARLRLEKRHNYVRKVAELAVQMFITADKPNVSGLVLAGSADFKSELQTSDMFDQRLASDYQCCN